MKKIRGALVVCLLMAVLLCVAEWGARILLLVSKQEPTTPAAIGRFDQELGWALKENAEGVSHWGEAPVIYKINSQGLRDTPTSFPKPDGVFRIVLLGDSITFGVGVPIQEHFSYLLEQHLQNVEVINLGVSGYGVDQELVMLRNHGLRYKPDMVITFVDHYGNHRHMYRARWGKQKPQFKLRDGKLVQTFSPSEPRKGLVGTLIRWNEEMRRRFTLYLIGSELYERYLSATPTNSAQDAEDARRLLGPEYATELQELGAAITREIATETKAEGATFVLMTRVAPLAQRMHALGLPVLDLTSLLDNPDLTLKGDPHPNSRANRLITMELIQFLQREQLLPAKYQHAGQDELTQRTPDLSEPNSNIDIPRQQSVTGQ